MTEHTDEGLVLDQWSRRLTQALQILDFEVDQKLVLELTEQSRSVSPSAGAVSALIVGYAAGLAAKVGKTESSAAVRSAAEVALQLCRDGAEGGPDAQGWTNSGQ
ncbi:MAG TPA: hypothetical protein DEP82_00050 [Arthrobacter bacterium]|jgi:hypothetical protein|nr:hypothetical protein [Arthrobacter sp.]